MQKSLLTENSDSMSSNLPPLGALLTQRSAAARIGDRYMRAYYMLTPFATTRMRNELIHTGSFGSGKMEMPRVAQYADGQDTRRVFLEQKGS